MFLAKPKGLNINMSFQSTFDVRLTLPYMLVPQFPKFILTFKYSNKKETSDFHGTVSFDPVKIMQQK